MNINLIYQILKHSDTTTDTSVQHQIWFQLSSFNLRLLRTLFSG